MKNANGVTGYLLNNNTFRVYDDSGFTDYEIKHCDLCVTIIDDDAYFYETSLEYSPETLGITDDEAGIKRNLFDELVEGMQALREEREGKMNKVIRKLAEQAMESTGVEELGGGYSGGYRELNPEKFAELIVRECISLIEPDKEHREDASWGYIGGEEGVELLDGSVRRIKEHFGVV